MSAPEAGALAPLASVAARSYAELVNFFSRSLNDRDAARDLVQEAFARLAALHAHGTPVADERALLYRVGKNLVVSGARRRAAEERMLQTLALVGADSAPSVEQQVDARQRLDRLMARLAVMPRKRREAFVLVRIYGYSYAEAGAFMGVTAAAVDRHVVRAVFDCMRHRGG
ncbi:MAG TPA: sigma-70 family RNA polymerase sigma factor [Pseudorhodoferax sp.]|nr:sigma-70 family RNA polymerase sigma factor [Pseudorhodoferax sp.]